MPEAAVNEDDGFVFGQDDVDGNGAALPCFGRMMSNPCGVQATI